MLDCCLPGTTIPVPTRWRLWFAELLRLRHLCYKPEYA